jgi:hypothetical protein
MLYPVTIVSRSHELGSSVVPLFAATTISPQIVDSAAPGVVGVASCRLRIAGLPSGVAKLNQDSKENHRR